MKQLIGLYFGAHCPWSLKYRLFKFFLYHSLFTCCLSSLTFNSSTFYCMAEQPEQLPSERKLPSSTCFLPFSQFKSPHLHPTGRPVRTNRMQGGVIAGLTRIQDIQTAPAQRKKKTVDNAIPDEAPRNPMAVAVAKPRKVCIDILHS